MEENIKDNKETQIYELGYHILPTVSEEDVAGEVSKIHSIISQSEGNIIGEGMPTMHQLSYEITKRIETKNLKFAKAYFGWIKFEVSQSEVAGIKNKIENLPNVLRLMIIKTIRESIAHTLRIPMFRKESNKEGIKKAPKEKVEISEEEIDKSIDELLVN